MILRWLRLSSRLPVPDGRSNRRIENRPLEETIVHAQPEIRQQNDGYPRIAEASGELGSTCFRLRLAVDRVVRRVDQSCLIPGINVRSFGRKRGRGAFGSARVRHRPRSRHSFSRMCDAGHGVRFKERQTAPITGRSICQTTFSPRRSPLTVPARLTGRNTLPSATPASRRPGVDGDFHPSRHRSSPNTSVLTTFRSD